MKIAKTVRQHGVYMTFWTMEKRWEGVLDFRNENGRATGIKEEQNRPGKQSLLGNADTVGHQQGREKEVSMLGVFLTNAGV